ncbi:MAG: 30S ribosomal protein S19e [Candidatus Diapherotrites archaeon]|uniref:30S ribosomal protein S19e n=1 Tax=Candidatus Iainarchaeum sp. TaxID=3101447 RepID=A0A938YWW5_9ARCH|nr:30S ribosomal protein S19e [Candidatus Diapherotrites archaeon]
MAKDFKAQGIERPAWSMFIKTGRHRERTPDRDDWFYFRMASIMYRVYKDGPVGTEALRTYYGGRKNRGTKRHHFYKASGKIVRSCLQQLEKLGYVKKAKKGRVITGKGQSYLNKKSKEVAAIAKKQPEKPVKQAKAEEEKSGEEKAVAAELKRKEDELRQKEKAKEEERKKEQKREEKKKEEAQP